jgi:hypothetical protein
MSSFSMVISFLYTDCTEKNTYHKEHEGALRKTSWLFVPFVVKKSKLHARLPFDAFLIGMFDLLHLRHKVGKLDQLLRRIPPGDDEM